MIPGVNIINGKASEANIMQVLQAETDLEGLAGAGNNSI